VYYILGSGKRKTSKEDHLGDLGVDGRTVLKWVLRKWGVKCGID